MSNRKMKKMQKFFCFFLEISLATLLSMGYIDNKMLWWINQPATRYSGIKKSP